VHQPRRLNVSKQLVLFLAMWLVLAGMHVSADTGESALGYQFSPVTPLLAAPDFTLEDMDGESYELQDYRGKVVVLDFWGDW